MFDRYVESFLEAYPQGTVIEVGCGLDTRFDRVDNGHLRWFDLDLPDTIALRRHFFDDEPRRTMIAASVLETDWMARVKATGGPWMFVAEAVLIYLDAADARRAIVGLAKHFPGTRIAFDTTGTRMVESQDRHDAMRHLPRESWYPLVLRRPAGDRIVGGRRPPAGVEGRSSTPIATCSSASRCRSGSRRASHRFSCGARPPNTG